MNYFRTLVANIFQVITSLLTRSPGAKAVLPSAGMLGTVVTSTSDGQITFGILSQDMFIDFEQLLGGELSKTILLNGNEIVVSVTEIKGERKRLTIQSVDKTVELSVQGHDGVYKVSKCTRKEDMRELEQGISTTRVVDPEAQKARVASVLSGGIGDYFQRPTTVS